MENDLIGPAFHGIAGDGDAALVGTLGSGDRGHYKP
jgi:hypothetical protein